MCKLNSGIDKQVEDLLAKVNTALTNLEEATNLRKHLEEVIEYCQYWFKQADINLATEVRNTTSPEILVEHIIVVRGFPPLIFPLFNVLTL